MSVRSVSKPQGFRPTLLLRVSLESEIERIVNVESQDFRPTLLKVSARYRIRNKSTSGRIWQYRFWDHIIRDQNDLNKHIDYIHYNPVKHNLVQNPFEWKYSSIHEFKIEGYYSDDWGVKDRLTFKGEFGE